MNGWNQSNWIIDTYWRNASKGLKGEFVWRNKRKIWDEETTTLGQNKMRNTVICEE